jgi:DNA-binding transcriptional LysR family regulator
VSQYEFPSRMDLRHLRYFTAVAEAGNVHRAAERLNIVQSALSRRILELESELALTLFERSAKGVALTESGKALLRHAQIIVDEADRAKTHMKDIAAGKTGRLRIGLNRIAPQLAIVPQALQQFRLAHPGVLLDLLPMTSNDQVEALRAGSIDLGLLSSQAEAFKDFNHRSVFKDYFILALPAEHVLAQPGLKLHLADLAAEDFVMFSRETGQVAYDKLLAAFATAGIRPNIVQESHSENAQLGLVAAGMGLTFTFSSITKRYYRRDLVFKPVEDIDIDIDIDLIWRRTDLSPLVVRFVAAVDEVLR